MKIDSRERALLLACLLLLTAMACEPIGPEGNRPESPCLEIRGAAATDAIADLRSALLEPDPICRTHRLIDSLLALEGRDITALDAVAQDSTPLMDEATLRLLFQRYAQLDAPAALASALRLSLYRREAAVQAAIESWATSDPRSAWRALDSLAANRRSRGMAEALALGWEAGAEPGLAEFLAEQPESPDFFLLLGSLVHRMVLRHGADHTAEWIKSVPDGLTPRLRLQVYRRAASAFATEDPQWAITWLETVEDPALRKNLAKRIAVRWIRSDPDSTMGWLATLPPGTEREVAVREAYRTLAGLDEERARRWFDRTDYGDWLEPALALYVVVLARTDPKQAIERAAAITDIRRREQSIVSIVRLWRRSDPTAANAWLEGSDLGPEAREWIEDGRATRPGSRAHEHPGRGQGASEPQRPGTLGKVGP